MKTVILAALVIFLSMSQVFACSEAGPHQFDLPAKTQSRCAKIALAYASDFAKSMVKVEKTEKGYRGPQGKFKPSHSEPVLYTTQNRSGNSKMIGFNVGLDFKDKWECNFCVEMAFDSEENCRIESIHKHMCAN
jgi:hypothetical protein